MDVLTLLILIPIALLLVLDYFIADEFRCIAQKKGYCGKKYFWWSFFTGFVGYLMVAALPDKSRFTPLAPADQKPAPIINDPYKCRC